MKRAIWLVAVAGLVVAACGGGGARPSATPATQITQPPTATEGQQTSQPNAGDNKAKAQALIPQGSSAPINEVTIGSQYSVQVTSSMTLDQLGAFWNTAIPAAGLTESGRYTASGSLIIAVTNPDGGITATETENGVLITITLGSSS
jgi:hypothetical protein